MSGGAITMMIIGMVIIWGGLLASVLNVVRVSRKKRNSGESRQHS